MTSVQPTAIPEKDPISKDPVAVEKKAQQNTIEATKPRPVFLSFTIGAITLLGVVEIVCKGMKMDSDYEYIRSLNSYTWKQTQSPIVPEHLRVFAYLSSFFLQSTSIALVGMWYIGKERKAMVSPLSVSIIGLFFTLLSIIKIVLVSACSCPGPPQELSVLRIIFIFLNEAFIPNFDTKADPTYSNDDIMNMLLALFVSAVRCHLFYEMMKYAQKYREWEIAQYKKKLSKV